MVFLPLNRVGFFESLENHVCPNGDMVIQIHFKDDSNVIYKATAQAGNYRYIITSCYLWVPTMEFHDSFNKVYLEKFFPKQYWTDLNEVLFESQSTRQRQGPFK